MYPLSIFLNLIIFSIVSLILVSFGRKILGIFKLNLKSSLLEFLISFCLGYGIFGYILYIIGLLKVFYFWFIWVILLILLIAAFGDLIYWLKKVQPIWQRIKSSSLWRSKLFIVLIITIGIWLFFTFVATVSPMVEFDSRWYHFGEARYYLENHRISIETFSTGTLAPSVFWTSAFPRLAEIFFATFLSFKAEIAAKLINFAFGLVGVLAIFYFARRKIGSMAALIAAAVVLVSGPFFVNSFFGYIDLILFGFSVMALLAIFIWREDENRDFRLIILAGIITGLALSIKLNGSFLIPIIILIIFVQSLILDKKWKKTFLYLGYYLFFSFLFSFAWYLDNKLHTGSFTYPFGTPNDEVAVRSDKIARSLRLFFDPVLLIFPFIALFIFGFVRKKIVLILFLLFSFLSFFVLWVWGSNTVNETRYLLPGLFGVAIISGFGFNNLQNYNKITRISVSIFVVLIILIQSIAFIKVDIKYIPYFIGLKTREQFLTEVIAPDWWSVYDYNGEIKRITKGSKVLVGGDASHTYFIDFPFVHASLAGIKFFEIDSPELLAQKIKEKGFDFVLIKRKDLSSLIGSTSIKNQEINSADSNPEIKRYFEKIYEDSYSEIILYRVR